MKVLIYLIILNIYLKNFILSTKINSSIGNKQMPCTGVCCPPEHALSVTGMAEAKLKTDIMKISITVETLDLNASNSQAKNSQIFNTLNNAISELGIPIKNITTTSFTITQSYKSVYNLTTRIYDRVFEGFKVTNNIQVTVAGLPLAGDLIDTAIASGATGIPRIEFVNDETQLPSIKRSLIIEASKNAVEKAKLVLVPLNINIKGVAGVSISDSNVPVPIYRPINNNLNRALAETPTFYEGENTVRIFVYVTFAIDNK